MSKICLFLRFYDKNRYNQFCCSFHSNLFEPNNTNIKNNIEVMNPDINEKTGTLFKIIQIYIDKLDPNEEDVNLFKFLSLDLSPCLQKKIAETYLSHFSNNSISNNIKLKTVQTLVNNKFFDIFEYVFSISLIDVKIILIHLLDILFKNFNKALINKLPVYMVTIFDYIAENLLPEQLVVEISKDNKTKIDCLSKYFNKKNYEEQIHILWKLLVSYLIKNNETTGKKINTLELNELYVNLLIYFVSKNNNINYINELLLLIQEYLIKRIL